MSSLTWRPRSGCGLYIDLCPGDVIQQGDWIATNAGARYLVTTARAVRSRGPADRNRWQLRTMRLDYDCDIPEDVRCWWLRWYSRRAVRVAS